MSLPPSPADPPTPPAPSSGEAEALLCPNCGYDLRAATSNRCSECGLEIDASALRESAVPWAHRRHIGRMGAYLKTVWYITIDSKRIRNELARRQDAGDAWRFRAVHTIVLAIVFIGAAAVAATEWGLYRIAVEPYSPLALPTFGERPLPGYIQDLAVPWSAGATLVPLIPLYLILLAMYLTGVARATTRLKNHPPEHRARAHAIAMYAAAPLAWLLLAVVLYAASYLLGRWTWGATDADIRLFRGPRLWTQIVACALAAAALFTSLRRSGEWYTRSYHAGVWRFTLGVLEMLGRSLVGIVALVGIVPWCLGLIWIVIDSFR